jgi:hypothetical protein
MSVKYPKLKAPFSAWIYLLWQETDKAEGKDKAKATEETTGKVEGKVEVTAKDTAKVTAEAKEVTEEIAAKITAEITAEVLMEAEADHDGRGVSQEGEKPSPPGSLLPVLHVRDVIRRAMSQQHVPTPRIRI